MYTPSAHIEITLDSNETTLKKAHITWHFSQEFIETIKPQYDKNKNGIFDKEDLADIQDAYVDYIEPLDFLTVIKYYSKQMKGTFEDVDNKAINVENYRTYQEENELLFSYDVLLNYPLKKEMILFIMIEDKGDFMNFMADAKRMNFNTPPGYKIIENANYNMVFFDFEDESYVVDIQPQPTPAESNTTKEEVQSGFLSTLYRLLAQTTSKIRYYLQEIKNEQSSAAFFSLMLFSLFYGIIHALGPGHGKTLVSSYFLSSNRDVKKAFYISLAIGVVHTFSALFLTLLIYFVLNVLLSSFMEDVTYYLTKISAVIIMIMALFLLYKKLPTKPTSKWSTHESTCGCHSCHIDDKKADLGLILGAGMIPCPTTVLIFIFTFSQGMYLTGFISALFMSTGMSVVIFIAAALSVKAREKSEEKFSRLANTLSFAGIGMIMILAIMMFVS